jgi:hypothetical protein
MAVAVIATRVLLGTMTATATAPVLGGLVLEGALLYALAMRLVARQQWVEFLGELGRLSAFTSLRAALRPRGARMPSDAPAGKAGA